MQLLFKLQIQLPFLVIKALFPHMSSIDSVLESAETHPKYD